MFSVCCIVDVLVNYLICWYLDSIKIYHNRTFVSVQMQEFFSNHAHVHELALREG